MQVLLPIDGSKASEATMEWATGFLSPETTVYLLHVIDPRQGTPFQEIVDELLKKARAIFINKGFRFVYAEQATGIPADTICEYADKKQIPMIIIGAQGKSEIGKLLMGSVSSGVFKKAKQQVLVLNNKPRPSLTMNIDNAFPAK
jgi:nucleotide-binding universal stress UspA family protein